MKLSDGWLDVTFEVGGPRVDKLLGSVGCHKDKVKMRNGAEGW